MERTEAYEASVKNLMEEYSITELKEIFENFTNYWDDEDDADRCDFINSFKYYKELSNGEWVKAFREAIRGKIADYDRKAIAAAKYFNIEPDEVEFESWDYYNLEVYSYGREEVAVGNDEEATAATTEEIKNSLWAFNVNFIESHMRSPYPLGERASKALERMLGELCEDANEIIESLIENLDEFIEDAINADGRGHFLSHYNGEENEIKIENETYYVYRIN